MHLTDYRHLTNQIRANLENDDRVLAFIALGSMAETSRTPDAWSDHDFFVITLSGVQEEFRQDLHWLPDNDRIVLKIRETPHGLKVFYDHGHLLEFAVFDETELLLAKVNDYQIIFDRANIATIIPQLIQPPTPKAYDPTRDFTMTIALLYVGMARYARGEHLSAHSFIKLFALYHLLPLLTHVLESDHKHQLDNLDAFRRFEQVFPEVGATINSLLLLPIPQAAQGLLELAAQHVQPTLPDYPEAAVAMIRSYIQNIPA